jgi:hypothetical protein
MRLARSGITLLLAVALVVLALSVIASGCNREEAREEGGDVGTTTIEPTVTVTAITVGRAVGPDSRVTDETSTFNPSDTIYTSVATEGISPSSTIVARWTFEDGQVVDEISRTIAPNGPEVTEFHISKPDGFPVGSYEVVILLDGQEVDRKSFSVEAGA